MSKEVESRLVWARDRARGPSSLESKPTIKTKFRSGKSPLGWLDCSLSVYTDFLPAATMWHSVYIESINLIDHAIGFCITAKNFNYKYILL